MMMHEIHRWRHSRMRRTMAGMDFFVVGAQLLLAVVFVTAGVAKLLDQPGSRSALAGFGVPQPIVPAAGLLLPLVELATAVALVLQPTARWGALAALLLLLAFMGAIAGAMARREAPDCHCFGQLHSAPAGRGTLIRNAVLAAVAAIVVVNGPAPPIDDWVAARSAAELVAFGTGVSALALAGLCARLWLDRRGLRAALDVERERTALFPAGVPVGAEAPRFEFPTVGGGTLSLETLLARGRPVALLFVSPGCGPCANLLPEVGRWQAALAEQLTIGIVSSGSLEDNQRMAAEYGLTDVIVQDNAELLTSYQLSGTPAAVVVTRDGLVANVPGNGLFEIEPLIRLTLRQEATAPTEARVAANGRPAQLHPAR
jgi:uncharacterized membrane protein YphA (DoxX/SURF4 family)/thiol-disulfide isomerase/thioredoxin